MTTSRRRCGKPNCRCVSGEPHESPALRFSEGGRYRTLTLHEADLAEVTAALGRYEAGRGELEAAAVEGVAELRARMAARRGQRR